MAMIHVNRGATSLGVFSEEEVREGLRTGRFAPTDIGWREGMATWQPLSQFPELGAVAPAAPPAQIGAVSTSETAAPRSGLPWENRQERGFFNAFVETLVMVLTKPGEAFTAMRREGGLGEPLIYALIGGCAGADDSTAAVDLGRAAERRSVRRGVADHAFEHLADRYRAILGGEGSMHPVALRLPFVLDDNGATDRVEIGIAPTVDIEVPRQCAIERGDGNRILDQRAGIGRAQFQGRIVERYAR